jgi:hypothetical protein
MIVSMKWMSKFVEELKKHTDKGFDVELDFQVGSIIIIFKDAPKGWSLYATPFWEGAQGVVMQANSDDGDCEPVADFDYELDGDWESDAVRYIKLIHRAKQTFIKITSKE